MTSADMQLRLFCVPSWVSGIMLNTMMLECENNENTLDAPVNAIRGAPVGRLVEVPEGKAQVPLLATVAGIRGALSSGYARQGKYSTATLWPVARQSVSVAWKVAYSVRYGEAWRVGGVLLQGEGNRARAQKTPWMETTTRVYLVIASVSHGSWARVPRK